MKKLYLIRHGETVGNVKNEVQGDDDPISAVGLEQAEKVANFLSDKPSFRLFSSDYPRALATAEKVALKNQVNIEERTYLREFTRPSMFVGKEREGEKYKEFLRLADENIEDKNWHYSDEENFFDLNKRVEEFFAEMETIDGDVVVVSHARTLILIIARIFYQNPVTPALWVKTANSFDIKNGSISTFVYGEGHSSNPYDFPYWRILELFYTDHLKE